MKSATIHLPPSAQRWLRNSPITPYVLVYLDYLTECRYADETSEHYLAGLAHLGLWMGMNHLTIEELDESLVTQFLDNHFQTAIARDLFFKRVPILTRPVVIFYAFCVIAVSLYPL